MYDISVIIPIYNVENYLQGCLESVINQNFDKQYEIIIVDDGSTDASPEICRMLMDGRSNIKFIGQENNGVNISRNIGIEAASGKYIMFVDGDDIVEPNILSSLYDVAMAHPEIDVVFCGCTRDYSNEKIICNYPSYMTGKIMPRAETVAYFFQKAHEETQMPFVSPWAKLFKTAFLTANGIKFPEIHVGGDECFMLEVVDKSKSNYFIDSSFYILNRTRLDSIMNRFMYNRRYLFAKYLQNDYALNYLYDMDISSISRKQVEIYTENLLNGFLGLIYSQTQLQIFESLVLSDKLDYKKNYLFYGDLDSSRFYYDAGIKDFENALFVSYNSLEYGRYIGPHKIISLDQAIEKMDSQQYKIIITDIMHFSTCFLQFVRFSTCFMQLFNRGLVNRFSDVMICDAKIPLEQWYEEGLALIFGHLMLYDLKKNIADDTYYSDLSEIDKKYNRFINFYDYVDTKNVSILTEARIDKYKEKVNEIYSSYINETYRDNTVLIRQEKSRILNEIADIGLREFQKLLNLVVENTGSNLSDDSGAIKKIISLYRDIQLKYFFDFIFFSNEESCDTILLFGASSLCQQYIRLAKTANKNIVLFDNDKNKHGSSLLGYKIESPERLKDYYTDQSRIIITSMYFREISAQLLEMGIINSIGELMLNRGKTDIERLFMEVLTKKDVEINMA